MRKMDNSVPELDWNMAAMALHQNGMDVEETCYVIQSEWLQPLYEYIFSEYTAIAKTDMEEIKKIIKNEAQYSLEVRTVKPPSKKTLLINREPQIKGQPLNKEPQIKGQPLNKDPQIKGQPLK